MKNTANTAKLHCFAPVEDADSRILILGSMPGIESLRQGEYYANKNNAMWRIIAALFNGGQPFASYEEKLNCLHQNHIAMWDTIKTCDREGSLDSAIKHAEFNDIQGFLVSHKKIVRVIANGRKAADSIRQNIDFTIVHSTSSACAIKFEVKLEEWRKLLTL